MEIGAETVCRDLWMALARSGYTRSAYPRADQRSSGAELVPPEDVLRICGTFIYTMDPRLVYQAYGPDIFYAIQVTSGGWWRHPHTRPHIGYSGVEFIDRINPSCERLRPSWFELLLLRSRMEPLLLADLTRIDVMLRTSVFFAARPISSQPDSTTIMRRRRAVIATAPPCRS